MLQRQAEQPLYLQLADQLADDIRDGVYACGANGQPGRRHSPYQLVTTAGVTNSYSEGQSFPDRCGPRSVYACAMWVFVVTAMIWW